MLSGTEKNPNPHTPPLSKFLRSLESPVSTGYVRLRKTNQLLSSSTYDRYRSGDFRTRSEINKQKASLRREKLRSK